MTVGVTYVVGARSAVTWTQRRCTGLWVHLETRKAPCVSRDAYYGKHDANISRDVRKVSNLPVTRDVSAPQLSLPVQPALDVPLYSYSSTPVQVHSDFRAIRIVFSLCIVIYLGVTIDGVWIGEWIYWRLIHTSRAIAQAVSRWLPTAVAWVRSRVWSSGICSGQIGAGAGFLRVLRFSLPIFIPPNSPSS
jgi:hypothetical protein